MTAAPKTMNLLDALVGPTIVQGRPLVPIPAHFPRANIAVTLDDQGRIIGWTYTGQIRINYSLSLATKRAMDQAAPWWKRITG